MGQVHLSYEDFKATYGDLGLTYWIKFNYLSMDYVGKYNIWDEDWEVGGINSSGEFFPYPAIRTKNMISVLPGKTYFIQIPSTSIFTFFYDEDKNFVSALGEKTPLSMEPFVIPDGCYYLAFQMSGNYGEVYHNDIRMYQPVLEE